MSFDWAEYLSIAEGLCGVPITGSPAGLEARQRAGVSRAYYAAYVSARNRLRDVDGIPIPVTVNPHLFVASHYATHGDPQRVLIGIELGRLRRDRNRCDYDDVVRPLPAVTRRSLLRARQILNNLKQL
jgi:hypothetical protein